MSREKRGDGRGMGAEQSAQRTSTYRGAKRPREDDRALERALQLMESADFYNLANARFPEIKGPVSWTKLGEFGVSRGLLGLLQDTPKWGICVSISACACSPFALAILCSKASAGHVVRFKLAVSVIGIFITSSLSCLLSI